MAITRTPMTDDDGSGTTGTILNNAWKQELYGQIDAFMGPVVDPVVIHLTPAGGVIDLAAPQPAPVTWFVLQATAPTTIRSITGVTHGQRVIISNFSLPVVWLSYMATGGAGAPLLNCVSSGPTGLGHMGSATYGVFYPFGACTLLAHEQGAWIDVPYNAANYWGSGWAVTAVDLATHRYSLRGRTLHTQVSITGTGLYGPSETTMLVSGWPYSFKGGEQSLGALGSVTSQSGGWGGLVLSAGPSYLQMTRTDFSPFLPSAVGTVFIYINECFVVT